MGNKASEIVGVLPNRTIPRNVNPWGRTLYVRSALNTASDNTTSDGQNPDFPLRTLARAVAISRAGDRILLGPGHTETLTASLTVSGAAISIEGIGRGQRAVINLGTTVANQLNITGTGILLKGFDLTAGVDAQTVLLNIAGTDCEIDDVRFNQTAVIQPLTMINVAAAAHRLWLRNLMVNQPDAGPQRFMALAAADNVRITNCQIRGDYSVAAIDNAGGAAINLAMDRCWLQNINATDAVIVLNANTSGWITNTHFRNTQADATQNAIAPLGLISLGQNFVVNADGETGKLVGTVSG